MATRYWVGGSGTWDASSTGNWSASSGGAAGASAPTSLDDVVFDSNSNVDTNVFTVTVSTASCNNFTAGVLDGAMTLDIGTSSLGINGSILLPTANFAFAGTGTINFTASSTNNSVAMNGVSVLAAIVFNGTGSWVLGSALASTNSSGITLTKGSFDTNDNSLTAVSFNSSNSNNRSIKLGSSTVTLSGALPIYFINSTGLTFNSGTSNILLTAGSLGLHGGGNAFYNVSFSSASGHTYSITGANTFNNLSFTSRFNTYIIWVSFGADQTINGVLTIGSTNAPNKRIVFLANDNTSNIAYLTGTRVTLTCNQVASLNDVDFKDIGFAGNCVSSGALTGTRLGDAGNNANIVFAAGIDKYYYNLTGGELLSAKWETSPTGTSPSINNFPLPQDNVIFRDFGLNSGATISNTYGRAFLAQNWDFTGRTLPMTFTSSTGCYSHILKDLKLSSTVTVGGSTSAFWFLGYTEQTITSAGVTLAPYLVFRTDPITGSVKLQDNLVSTSSTASVLHTGKLSLNNKSLTCSALNASSSFVRSIDFDMTGEINLTGTGTVFTNGTITGFTSTGNGSIVMTSASAKTFQGAGGNYPTLVQAGAGALTVTGANTFASIINTVKPCTITFPTVTTTVKDLKLVGDAANLLTINSATAGTRGTINVTGTTKGIIAYASVKDISASGTGIYTYGITDAGNNLGFTALTEYSAAIASSDQANTDLCAVNMLANGDIAVLNALESSVINVNQFVTSAIAFTEGRDTFASLGKMYYAAFISSIEGVGTSQIAVKAQALANITRTPNADTVSVNGVAKTSGFISSTINDIALLTGIEVGPAFTLTDNVENP